MICPLCDEQVTAADDFRPINGDGRAHRECLLRMAVGGIGHLEDHAYWCGQMHDPDGGRTPRQSALEVDEWVAGHGIAAAFVEAGPRDTRCPAQMTVTNMAGLPLDCILMEGHEGPHRDSRTNARWVP